MSPCPFAGTGFEWPSPGFFSQRPLLLELDPIQPATRSQETGSQSGGRVLHYWVKAARLPFKVVHRGSLPKTAKSTIGPCRFRKPALRHTIRTPR